MSYWSREIAGWLCLLLGLFGFYLSVAWLSTPHISESAFLVFSSVVVFRGGIHLLKVAVAARVCMEAQQRLFRQAPAAPTTAPAKTPRRPTTAGRP